MFPTPREEPLLYITIQPRYSIFLESDENGSFIVDASISHIFGQTYENVSCDSRGEPPGKPLTTLKYEIFSAETGVPLVSDSVHINSTDNVIGFSLSSFNARLKPYKISFHAKSPDGQQSFTASTKIFVLPSRSYGSAVKIDNLYGGLYVQNALNDWSGWYPVFPNGYYGDGSYLTPSNVTFSRLDTYAAQGFNTINIVPDGGAPEQSYPTAELIRYWDRMDELNLFNIYDMRFAFQNATRISDQVEMWKNRTTLLMWYTADEPDGWVYALNSTKLAYDQLKTLDPYHPVSLVLNCQNFYYEEYASGADIIYEDAYPVGINATWSIPFGIPCNTTYGDCGCDNCIGALTDVSTRLDDLQNYQANLKGQGKKPSWAVVQAFGAQEYWQLVPSAVEVENMMMLAINHDAKGISNWIYPSTEEVNVGSGNLGKVFTTEPGRDFLFGANAIKGLVVDQPLVDVSAWLLENQMMIGIVNGNHTNSDSAIRIKLPKSVSSIDTILYGDSRQESWIVEGNQLIKTNGLKGLEVSILILTLGE